MFLPWTDLLSPCHGSLLNSFLREARNPCLAAVPGPWPWPGTCVPALFLWRNHEETQLHSSSPMRSVYARALHPGHTPPSSCFLTIRLPCMLISLTVMISSGIVHKCSGHFGELLKGMRALIWKVPWNKKVEKSSRGDCLVCVPCLAQVSPPSFQYLGIDNCWLFNWLGWWNRQVCTSFIKARYMPLSSVSWYVKICFPTSKLSVLSL